MTKMISLADEVYDDLQSLKNRDESFGAVIKDLIRFYKDNKDRDGIKL